jgi:cell division transport system permease protein
MKSGSTYFYSVFATTLVLVVIGVVFTMAERARQESVHIKENLMVEVVLRNDASKDSIDILKKMLTSKSYVKKIAYVSKEQAAQSLKKELGENYLDILGYNPLYPSYHVNLNENNIYKKSYDRIQREIAALPAVAEVNIQKEVLTEIEKAVKNFEYVGFTLGGVFLLFAVSLIFSAIRLDVFSHRQIIKSMQLFGATKWFIMRPYLGRALANGMISGIVAPLLTFGICYYLDYKFPELALTADLIIFALLSAALIVLGISISFLSTLVALSRYLNYKIDE